MGHLLAMIGVDRSPQMHHSNPKKTMSSKHDMSSTLKVLQSQFSSPTRLAVLGSLSFSNPNTEGICRAIGQKLVPFQDLILITGGVSGIPEAVSRSLWCHRKQASTGGSSIYHIQPQGFDPWDYGENLIAGKTMEERRYILAQLAPVYLLLEGGLGAEQEAQMALKCGALLIPVGCSGGAARSLFDQFNAIAMESLPEPQQQAWRSLNTYADNPEDIATAVITLVQGTMQTKERPL